MKKTIAALLAVCLLSAWAAFPARAEEAAAADPAGLVEYGYSPQPEAGRVRYVCQQAEDDTFYEEYWGEWATWAGQECGTACISMALSYLGIDAEPKDLAEWWISRMGFFGAVFRDVPEAQAQEQVPFFQAWDNYVGGQGLYSPVVLRLPPELNPYQTGNSHYVLVLGQYEDGAWAAADPAVPELLRLFIREDGLSYQVEVETADGTILSGKADTDQLQLVQYHVDALPTPEPTVSPDPADVLPPEDAGDAGLSGTAEPLPTPDPAAGGEPAPEPTPATIMPPKGSPLMPVRPLPEELIPERVEESYSKLDKGSGFGI